jgi:hypothetical protein
MVFMGGLTYSLELVMGCFMPKVSEAVFQSGVLKRVFQEDLRNYN